MSRPWYWTPTNFIATELRHDHSSGFWFAPGVDVVPVGYFVNSTNTVRTPAYTLLNVKVGYDYKPWNLAVFFEGRNLTDKPFVSAVQVDDATGNYFFPGDQRGFYGSVAWRWK